MSSSPVGLSQGSGVFSRRSCDRLIGFLPVVAALLLRHWDCTPSDRGWKGGEDGKTMGLAVPHPTLDEILKRGEFRRLTARERETVALMLKGHSSKSIAHCPRHCGRHREEPSQERLPEAVDHFAVDPVRALPADHRPEMIRKFERNRISLRHHRGTFADGTHCSADRIFHHCPLRDNRRPIQVGSAGRVCALITRSGSVCGEEDAMDSPVMMGLRPALRRR